VETVEKLPAEKQAAVGGFFWWIRKGGTFSQEVGLVTGAGARWVIRNNLVRDTIDGLSFMSMSWSDHADVYENRFERNIDNAIESENHAQNMRFHHNEIVDVMEGFSYQPMAPEQAPANILIYNNVFSNSPKMVDFWTKPIIQWSPGVIKIRTPDGISPFEKDRFVFFNNTVYYPKGNILTISSKAPGVGAFRFFNNIAITDEFVTNPKAPGPPVFQGWEFMNNMVAPAMAGKPGPGLAFAGKDGMEFKTSQELGLADAPGGDFSLLAQSPIVGKGVIPPGFPEASKDPGASPAGEKWKPPVVGPQVTKAAGATP
jgi:Periplasmic copper-binding protein (NosD)